MTFLLTVELLLDGVGMQDASSIQSREKNGAAWNISLGAWELSSLKSQAIRGPEDSTPKHHLDARDFHRAGCPYRPILIQLITKNLVFTQPKNPEIFPRVLFSAWLKPMSEVV